MVNSLKGVKVEIIGLNRLVCDVNLQKELLRKLLKDSSWKGRC